MVEEDIAKELCLKLNIIYEEIQDIKPHSIGFVLNEDRQVVKLSLHRCGIRSIRNIYQWLKKFPSLTHINLSGNPIKNLYGLSNLKNIVYLDIRGTKFFAFEQLKNSYKLRTLLIQDNSSIISLPRWLFEKDIDVAWTNKIQEEHICINNHSIQTPPIEVIKLGKNAILNYFDELEKDTDAYYLYEAKLIVVGEERGGKSTLIEALTQKDFVFGNNKNTTHGIEVSTWIIPKSKTATEKDFRFNVWDFGGQEIYHATHQFFLTRKAIYLFVSEARKDLRYEDFYYWLNIINTLASESPVFLVQTKTDQDHKRPDISLYKESFNQIEGDLQSLSCNTENEKWNGIYKPLLEVFKENIYSIIKDKRIEGIGDPLPKVWVEIRKEIAHLQSKGINYITQEEYLRICEERDLSKERALFLSGYFHELGVFLHFRDDIQLSETIFINHQWLTKAIYYVFDNKKIQEAYGKFTDDDLMDIWNDPQFRGKHSELSALLKNPKFKLCYFQEGYYLAPQLFNNKAVEYKWEKNKKNLFFRYNYAFMPKGILSQLIVVLHKDIFENTFWLHGVLFKYKNSKAIVKENRFKNENTITIQVEGREKKELLSIVRHKIDEINKEYSNLFLSEEYGCRCDECELLSKPHYFKEKIIQRAMRKKRKTLECQNSFYDININQLLGDYLPSQLDVEYEKLISGYDSAQIKQVLTDTKEIKNNLESISLKINNSYEFLMNDTKNKFFLEEIEKVTSIILNRQSEIIINQIVSFIIDGLTEFDDEMNVKLDKIVSEIKEVDDWETKVKLSIPLLNLVGVNVENEFNLSRYIQRLLAN